MTMRNLEVTTALLESKVNEEVYVTLPKEVILYGGCLRVGSDSQAYMRLLNSLYSVKQASHNCFETLDNFLMSIGM